MTELPVYILAGGRSRRFGSDKARALVAGVPLLVHVAAALRPVTPEPTVVADTPGKYADLGFRTIVDGYPGRGPLGGLHAALADLAARAGVRSSQTGGAANAALVLVSCDFVVLRAAWIEALRAALHGDTVAAAFGGAHWEPLPGIYRAPLLEVVEKRLQSASGGALHALLDTVNAVRVPVPSDWPPLAHVNTPPELALAIDTQRMHGAGQRGRQSAAE
ncbi:MAG: molybdenum cofactor guanylyltransferase [Phycisphaerales bacterium]|nr:molybdenum cofactor guanylyltransferase [Phycisphaerales bacterium]